MFKKKDTERKPGKKVTFLHEDDRQDEHNYEPILHVHIVNKIDLLFLQLMVKGQPCNMELDTGSYPILSIDKISKSSED